MVYLIFAIIYLCKIIQTQEKCNKIASEIIDGYEQLFDAGHGRARAPASCARDPRPGPRRPRGARCRGTVGSGRSSAFRAEVSVRLGKGRPRNGESDVPGVSARGGLFQRAAGFTLPIRISKFVDSSTFHDRARGSRPSSTSEVARGWQGQG